MYSKQSDPLHLVIFFIAVTVSGLSLGTFYSPWGSSFIGEHHAKVNFDQVRPRGNTGLPQPESHLRSLTPAPDWSCPPPHTPTSAGTNRRGAAGLRLRKRTRVHAKHQRPRQQPGPHRVGRFVQALHAAYVSATISTLKPITNDRSYVTEDVPAAYGDGWGQPARCVPLPLTFTFFM